MAEKIARLYVKEHKFKEYTRYARKDQGHNPILEVLENIFDVDPLLNWIKINHSVLIVVNIKLECIGTRVYWSNIFDTASRHYFSLSLDSFAHVLHAWKSAISRNLGEIDVYYDGTCIEFKSKYAPSSLITSIRKDSVGSYTIMGSNHIMALLLLDISAINIQEIIDFISNNALDSYICNNVKIIKYGSLIDIQYLDAIFKCFSFSLELNTFYKLMYGWQDVLVNSLDEIDVYYDGKDIWIDARNERSYRPIKKQRLLTLQKSEKRYERGRIFTLIAELIHDRLYEESLDNWVLSKSKYPFSGNLLLLYQQHGIVYVGIECERPFQRYHFIRDITLLKITQSLRNIMQMPPKAIDICYCNDEFSFEVNNSPHCFESSLTKDGNGYVISSEYETLLNKLLCSLSIRAIGLFKHAITLKNILRIDQKGFYIYVFDEDIELFYKRRNIRAFFYHFKKDVFLKMLDDWQQILEDKPHQVDVFYDGKTVWFETK